MNQSNQHNKHSDSRLDPRIDPITRLMYGLYLDHNFTLQEIADLFKVTRQAVSLRFVKLKMRPSGRKKGQCVKYPKWQITLLNRLTSYGLTATQAGNILSINNKTATLRNKNKCKRNCAGFNNCKVQFKTPQVARVYQEFKYLILVDAWNNGATIKELSEIFDYTEAATGRVMVRLRGRKGYNLKYRREDLRRD